MASFYTLLVVTCLTAPMCHYDTAESFGLLVTSTEECETTALKIAEARARGHGFEAEWKCSAPEVAGTWHAIRRGTSSNGLWSASQARGDERK
jgi:hypothetical protein